MSRGSIFGIVAAGSCLALVVGTLYVLTRAPVAESESKKKRKAERSPIEKSKLIKVYSEISQLMQVVIVNLAQHEQELRANAKAANKQLPNAEIEQYIFSQFSQAMKEAEKKVYMDNNITEEKLREGIDFFSDDEELVAVIENMKKLYRAVLGESSENTQVPEHVTAELTLKAMTEMMLGLNDDIETFHASLIEKGVNVSTQEALEEMQKKYNEFAQIVKTRVHERYNLSEEVLQNAIMKYQTDPNFVTAISGVSIEHRNRLTKLGFGPAS